MVAIVEESHNVTALPAWLVELYTFYGRKEEFDMLEADFPGKYPDLVRLLSEADPRFVIAIPSRNLGVDESGQARGMKVQIAPAFLYEFGKLRHVHRQVTMPDGEKVNLRSPRYALMASMCGPALASDVAGHIKTIHDPRNEYKKRLCSQVWLRYEIALRWADLPGDLRAQAEAARDLHIEAPTKRRRTAKERDHKELTSPGTYTPKPARLPGVE